jgi:hypothetical protein
MNAPPPNKHNRPRAKGTLPPSARPWGREEDLHRDPEMNSPGGKAEGAFKPTARFDAPFALVGLHSLPGGVRLVTWTSERSAVRAPVSLLGA